MTGPIGEVPGEVPGNEPEESIPERLLDLFVFAPVGLVATAVDDFPALVARGRERLGVRVRSAHAVGRFAVDVGGKELGRRAGSVLRRPGGQPRPTAATTPSSAASPDPTVAPATAPGPPHAAATSPRAPSAPPRRPARDRSPAGPSRAPGAASSRPRKKSSPSSRPTVDLAIPGYDTLSASQVVRRLDGLGEAELEAVFTYESRTRGRRTILHRIRQIRGEVDRDAGGGPTRDTGGGLSRPTGAGPTRDTGGGPSRPTGAGPTREAGSGPAGDLPDDRP